MAKHIIFRMAAWTDAAGKYNPNAPLDGNEDNYYVDDDLGDDTPSHMVADEDILLSDCGMLMAVADGMGGMNAGEIASQIAHDTVAEFFAPGKITPLLAANHESRSRYLEEVVRETDRRIKEDARINSEHEGMGSTLIMAWIVNGELTLTWIGDSRAYRFNPATGIEPLSRDHSYVQELADKGIITYEQTFEHPQGNIVTRSLGDTTQKAKPESRLFKVYDKDIILLCSDGLSGVLRDKKTYDENGLLYPGDNLEDIIATHQESLRECREALWIAAEKADWYDNVTAILCKICSGAGACLATDKIKENIDSIKTKEKPLNKTFDGLTIRVSRKKIVLASVLCSFLICGVLASLFFHGKGKKNVETPSKVESVDSTKVKEKVDTVNVDFPKKKIKVKKLQKAENKSHNEKKRPVQLEKKQQDGKKDAKQGENKPSKTSKTGGFKLVPIENGQDKLTHDPVKGSDKDEITPVKKKQEQSK